MNRIALARRLPSSSRSLLRLCNSSRLKVVSSSVSLSVSSKAQAALYSSASSPSSSSIAIDNKTIANKQKLYVIDQLTPGSIFFLPHGARIFNRLIEFMRVQQRLYGFEEVITPLIYKQDLWKTSGHYQHYKQDMFEVIGEHHHEGEGEVDESHYGLKPMNCPGSLSMIDPLEIFPFVLLISHRFTEMSPPVRFRVLRE